MVFPTNSNKKRLSLRVQGTVQGVGFRPFIYRLATELNLSGWVNNSTQGVWIEVEGTSETLEMFLKKLASEKPPHSQIHSLETRWLHPIGYSQFEIQESEPTNHPLKTAIVLPDLATCSDCLAEIFDPNNRRYRYPFTNCTNCGPRYSIIAALPYDRENTTMRQFLMCSDCQAEYKNPRNRRFHAQPNACAKCGPHLELWDVSGKPLASQDQALREAVAAIRGGQIAAIKGLGGFHLMVDARNVAAVNRLRQRKQRPYKPFALMYPSLARVQQDCDVSPLEAKLLQSSESPIVLLRLKTVPPCSCQPLGEVCFAAVAPHNPYLGVMLPYTPLHYLLMAALDFPVVATSGNLSDEPICTDEFEAIQRLQQIADVFLVHNRPIFRPVDDSMIRVILRDQPMILRRARGYAPLPQSIIAANLSDAASGTIDKRHHKILAVGGHLKNTIAIAFNHQVFLSQHLGDLATPQAFQAFQQAIHSLSGIYDFVPDAIACDAHPDYRSTQFAYQAAMAFEPTIPVIAVQHHYAHVLACMAEHQLTAPVLGVAWDGTGYGLDHTIWGGEFLEITPTSFKRVAHWRTFPLVGGDKAVQEPWRIAFGLLYEVWGETAFLKTDLESVQALKNHDFSTLQTMLKKRINTPQTSSVGRLFDGVAALLGMCHKVQFEGQAAMELEFAINGVETEERYGFNLMALQPLLKPVSSTVSDSDIIQSNLMANSAFEIDWKPMIQEILADQVKYSTGFIAAKFHNTLAEAIVRVAQQLGISKVVLTGGCFQNRYLLEKTISRLRQENFDPYWHQQVPPNDGGLALGQVMALWRR